MTDLTITLTAASILGLMFLWLSFRVISVRLKTETLVGDAGDDAMLWAIRIHGNFCEYTTIFLLVLGPLEFMGGHQTALAGLAGLFILARLLHVPGMGPDANLKLRQAGILGSMIAIAGACLYGLFIALT